MPDVIYHVLRMETLGTPPVMNGGVAYSFENPQEAANFAKQYSKLIGEKLCVKPVVDAKWKQRETKRMADGTYRPLPWTNTTWWQSDMAYAIHKDHFPHAALEKPGWIAYTKTEADGAKDKQSLLRPGAYLNQYFTAVLNAYNISDRKLVEQFMTMYGPLEVKFAETEKDILKVYARGPQTCLHEGRHYPKDIHPAAMYAAGDLQIAYIGDIDGKVSARALVWPAKKLHSRVYGDIARLTLGLTRLGYKWGAPIGAKIKRVQLNKVSLRNGNRPEGCFLVPYLDKKNQQGGGHLGVIDKGDHLEICMDNEPGSHHCGGPDGYSGAYVPRLDEKPVFTCERCEGKTNALLTVYCSEMDEDGQVEDIQSWCAGCANNNATQCAYCGEYVDENVNMINVGGHWWLEYYANMYAKKCEGNGKWYQDRDMLVVFNEDGTYRRLSKQYLVEAKTPTFQSTLTGRHHFMTDHVRVWETNFQRYDCSKSEARQHSFECVGCNQHWITAKRNQTHGDDRLYCPNCHAEQKGEKPKKSANAGGITLGTITPSVRYYDYNPRR